MLVEVNNQTKNKIKTRDIKEAAEMFLKKFFKIRADKEVSIALVDGRTIRRLNRIYRRKDKITDVLTFAGEGDFLGEVIINYGEIKRQAPRYRHTAREELLFILSHGLLHLLGYQDEKEKERKKMEEISEKFLRLKKES